MLFRSVCLHNSVGNAISTNSLNTIIPNAMENCKLGDAGFDEYDLFSPPSFEEEICFDDTIPPIYDDYNDECDLFSPSTIEHKFPCDYDMPPIYDDYNDGYGSFTLTITNENDFTYVESNNDTFMHMDHDKNFTCDGYIVDFINDATESFYEKGRHGFIYHNNIESPLLLLKFLKLHLFCLPMLVNLCFMDLFTYKIPMHRKWVRLK